jgi:hypothetical protein
MCAHVCQYEKKLDSSPFYVLQYELSKRAARWRRFFAVLWLAERKSLHPLDSNKAPRCAFDITEVVHQRIQNDML